MRASTKGSQKRARGGAYCRDVRGDPVNDDEVLSDKQVGPCGAEWRGRRHEGTKEAGSDHRDDTEEVIGETDQRKWTEGRQSSYRTGDTDDEE